MQAKFLKKQPTAIISLGRLFGGMEMNAFRLAEMLRDSTEVTLIVKQGSHLDKYYKEKAQILGVHVETIKFKMFFSPSIIFNVRRIVKNKNIKNIIFLGASEMRSIYFSLLGLDINLIIRHGMKKTTPKKDLLHRLIYSKVNWHVSICQYLVENVREIIPFGKVSREKLIYSSLRHIPDNLYEPTIRNSAPIRLLHVARIAPGKGQVDAIKACQVLYDRNIPFELTCIGEMFPPFEKRFQSVLQSVPYKDSVKILGFSNKVMDYMREADIYIYPSSGEGLSNSFIEALSHGLICIAYSNTSFPELRQLGFEFFLVKNDDLKDLKEQLLDAIEYRKNNKIPIQHNVNLAKKVFDATRQLNEYLEILK